MSRDPVAAFVERGIRSGRMPGAAWWVEDRRGPRSRGALGTAEIGPPARPVADSTPWDLASLTKPLCTGLLLALLEQDGLLPLRRPAGAWLPEIRRAACGRASLLALASHTAGLPAWRPLFAGGGGIDRYLERIAAEPTAEPPGGALYSDLGYIVLGAVLERATGRGLDALFAERVAGPLGLRRTGFAVGPRAWEDAAATERGNAYERRMAGAEAAEHDFRAEVIVGRVHDANAYGLGGVAGHAGLFGTVDEVAALAREILRPAALGLGDRARSRLLAVVPASGGRTVGMVTAAASEAARGLLPDEAPGHTGFTGTSIWLDPAGDRFFVLLTNRVHPRVPAASFRGVRRGFHRVAAGWASR